jgi:hypothetical protein
VEQLTVDTFVMRAGVARQYLTDSRIIEDLNDAQFVLTVSCFTAPDDAGAD